MSESNNAVIPAQTPAHYEGPLLLKHLALEMRIFSDRSWYDAIATLLTARQVQLRRFTRNYSTIGLKELIIERGDGDLFFDDEETYNSYSSSLPQILIRSLFPEYTFFDASTRNSLIICNKEGEVLGTLAVFSSNEAQELTVALMAEEQTAIAINRGLFKILRPSVDDKIKRIALDPTNGQLIIQPMAFNEGRGPEYYARQAYPHCEHSPKELWEMWKASNSACMMFYGKKGTGKSSYAQQMLYYRGYKNVYFTAEAAVVEHPGLINILYGLPSGSLVIFEEADNMLGERETNPIMGSLLNITSGVVERDLKLLFITNKESHHKVDTNLMRSGRMYDRIQFRLLKPEEVNIVRESLGLPLITEKGLATLEEYSFGDAIDFTSIEEGRLRKEQRTGIGF